MKFPIIKFLLIYFFAFAQFIEAKECILKEKYINYHFLNGINVPQLSTPEGRDSIEDAFRLENISILYNPTIYEGGFATQINSQIKTMNPNEYLLLDILGHISLIHLHILHYAGVGIRAANDIFFEVLPQKIQESQYLEERSKIKDNTKMFKNMVLGPLVDNLNNSLSSNHANIIFAHSQGNLVANSMCLRNRDKHMEIISIASPAANTPCNHYNSYSLFDNDRVINTLKNTLNASKLVADKTDQIVSTREKTSITSQFLIPNASAVSSWDILNHLIDTYLDDPKVRNHLSQQLLKTKSYIYEKELNFDFVKINLDYDQKKFSEFPEMAGFSANDLNEFKWNYIIYTQDRINQYIRMNRYRLRHRMNFVKEEWDILLDKKFFVSNIKQYAQVIKTAPAFDLDKCRFANKNMPFYAKVCNVYPNTKEIISKNLKINSVQAPEILLLYANKKTSNSLSCIDAQLGKTPLKLTYMSSKKQDQQINILLNQRSFNAVISKANKVQQSKIILGELEISENERGILKYDLINLNSPYVGKRINTDSIDPETTACNSYRKLFSPSCANYYKRLQSLI